MKNKLKMIVGAVVLLGLGFYGGTLYTQSKTQGGNQSGMGTRQQRTGISRGTFGNGGSVSGEIITKDDKSITIKLRDGGSKIIFFSDATRIMKSTDGALSDLVSGQQVSVMGLANQDGSVTAQSIQLRPGSLTP